MVESGLSIPFATRPPLTKTPRSFSHPKDPVRRAILQQEVDTLILKGAIYPVLYPGAGFYGNIFTVPKKNGKWRLVVDLSPLNVHVKQIPFKMETAASVRLAIRPGDWATSIDLSDAYFHITMSRSARRYLRFVWNGTVYEWLALPFGYSLAPLAFTKVTKEFAACIRREGIRLRVYLDDWLILHTTRAGCLTHTHRVVEVAVSLGFVINEAKSDLVPSQTFEYLGMLFRTASFTVQPTERRASDLLEFALSLCQRSHASVRQLSRLLGLMESVANLIPLGRVEKRPLQREVKNRASLPLDYDQSLVLGPWFTQAVSPWLNREWLTSGVPISPERPEQYLYSDASLHGWGAHLGALSVSGLWTAAEARMHINALELEAVSRGLAHFAHVLRGSSVVVCGDNTTALAYIRNQGGTFSDTLSIQAETLCRWVHRHDLTLSVQFVPGQMNLVADLLSRSSQVLPTEWTIAHHALHRVWARWGKSMVDLFANSFTHRLPLYCSPVQDPAAWRRDAFAFSWAGLDAYAFPPTALIPKVLVKFRQDRPTLTLITPFWPKATWFPEVVSLSHEAHLPLDLR